MRVALYARVSTINGSQSPELQLREMHEHCRHRKWTVAAEYVDRASGLKDTRPQLNAMMADARHGLFEAVLVWKFDRFARSVSHLLHALETFRSLDIQFVSLTEGVDTSTPMGKMVFTVLGAVAELERSLIVERVRAGLRAAKARGVKVGRPREFNFDPAKVRARMKAGESLRAIARELEMSPSGLLKRLRREKSA